MAENTLALPWGKDSICIDLPETWRIVDSLTPAGVAPVMNATEEIQAALRAPIGLSALAELARGKLRVAIVIDDASRPTPVSAIFPLVLAELDAAGVDRANITVVPALGLHRPMTAAELSERVGEALSGLRWENPDCDDEGKLAFLGTTSRGTPVWLAKAVVDADLVVSVGCIEPHIIASFGGGYKNLVPGVAGRATVAHNHSLNCAPDTFNNVGRTIEKNPMRLDLEEGAAMLKAPVFIVNAIMNFQQEVVRVVAGHPVAAHRYGAQISAGLYGAKVAKSADVVITSSNPMDQDLRQGVKALANTIRAVRRGGVVMTFVRAEEGTGVFGLANKKLPIGKKALRFLAPVLLPLVPKLKLKGMGEEDRFFLYFALQAMRHAHLLMYAPTIPENTQENLPFIDFYKSPQELVAASRKHVGEQAEVLVFPHGGITYPDIA